MSIRSGLSAVSVKTNVPLATALGLAPQQQIAVPKGTYLISGCFNIVYSGAPGALGSASGVTVSLKTTNALPGTGAADAEVPLVIFRNTATTAAASVSLPCGGAITTQIVVLNTVYTFATDAIIYLNIGAVSSTAVTWGAVSSGGCNQITFTQIAV